MKFNVTFFANSQQSLLLLFNNHQKLNSIRLKNNISFIPRLSWWSVTRSFVQGTPSNLTLFTGSPETTLKINSVLANSEINSVSKAPNVPIKGLSHLRKEISTGVNYTPQISLNRLKKLYIFKNYVFIYQDFNKDSFIKFLMENLHMNGSYSLLFKLGFYGNTVFYMLDHQLGITIKESHNTEFYEGIYDIILLKLDILFDRYQIDE